MRLVAVIPVAFAAAPLAAAAGTLGFCLGNTKTDGSCKFQADYEADFDALKGVSTLVRTYTSSGCNTAQQILPAAAAKGFKVVLGVWWEPRGTVKPETTNSINRPDTQASYDEDYTALQSALSDPSNVAATYAITVGSEGLYRGSYTADQLVANIQNMSSAFPNMKIGTADSWNKFQDGTADPVIKAGVKLLFVPRGTVVSCYTDGVLVLRTPSHTGKDRRCKTRATVTLMT